MGSRKKYPNPKKWDFSKEVKEKMLLCTALIRVAVAMDRRNTASAIESIQVLQDQEGDSCVVVATPGLDVEGMINDISFELWAVKQELAYFSKVLKCHTSIVEGDRMEPGEEIKGNSYISS